MSLKPLAERLQVKRGRRLVVLHAPDNLGALPASGPEGAEPGVAEVVLVFCLCRQEVAIRLARALDVLRPGAILWLAFPKLSSRLAGDLSRDVVRAMALERGLNTVSLLAIDEDWSAMRLKRTL